MDIENPHILVSQNGDRWAVIVKWTATFHPLEVSSGFEFEDSVALWEWDTSDHDHISNSAVAPFRPTSTSVSRSAIWNFPGDALDTELGAEEIRAQVFLRNRTTSGTSIHKYTPIVSISPD